MTNHALLLINLGSPASPEKEAVRRYLNQFLMDPYVIDVPWPLRRLIVSLVLIKRPEQSAHAYASIWWDEGSPLVELTRRLQAQVATRWAHGPVEIGMRYGEPSIDSVLRDLARRGVDTVTLAPLYPQFADSTITTAVELARDVVKTDGLDLTLKLLPPFYDQPDYIDALVTSAQPWLEHEFDHLLLSFHGLPESHIRKLLPKGSQHNLRAADCCREASAQERAVCYRGQCLHTARAFAHRMGLPEDKWSVSFQSRLGKNKWIEPYTEPCLDALAAKGVKRLLVMCPAFVADCIETLEEIGIRGAEQFREAGGEELVLVPCLNDNPQWADVLTGLCERLAR
jgi:ferrochelatase